ncbi:hypothetical protein [Microbacterium maritypicum]|nr:hypothetical protein [Microbacterium liquefaciens]
MTNPPEHVMTTVALGRRVGYSAQQLRDLARALVIRGVGRLA